MKLILVKTLHFTSYLYLYSLPTCVCWAEKWLKRLCHSFTFTAESEAQQHLPPALRWREITCQWRHQDSMSPVTCALCQSDNTMKHETQRLICTEKEKRMMSGLKADGQVWTNCRMWNETLPKPTNNNNNAWGVRQQAKQWYCITYKRKQKSQSHRSGNTQQKLPSSDSMAVNAENNYVNI